QAPRRDATAMQDDVVAYRYTVADLHGVTARLNMEDGIVLDIRVRADPHVKNIAADDRIGPDAGVFSDDHVADHLRACVNVSRCCNARRDTLKAANHSVIPVVINFFRSIHQWSGLDGYLTSSLRTSQACVFSPALRQARHPVIPGAFFRERLIENR